LSSNLLHNRWYQNGLSAKRPLSPAYQIVVENGRYTTVVVVAAAAAADHT